MAKDYAKAFYQSREWKECRDAYARSVGGLCEVCLQNGRYSAGEIVHHKKHVSPETIHDPTVLLDWSNLQLVCRLCHGEIHRRPRRFTVDEFGHVTPR